MKSVIALIFLFVSGIALAQSPLSDGADGLGLARLKDYSAARVSSGNKYVASNDDSKRIMPGETLVMADLKGAGVVTHIWLTVADNEFGWPRLAAHSRLLRRRQDAQRGRAIRRLLRRGARVGAQSELHHGPRQLVWPSAQQLLADALSQVVPHHGDQRRQSPGPHVLLPRGLPQVRFPSRGHWLLSCLLPAGAAGAQRPQLRVPQH